MKPKEYVRKYGLRDYSGHPPDAFVIEFTEQFKREICIRKESRGGFDTAVIFMRNLWFSIHDCSRNPYINGTAWDVFIKNTVNPVRHALFGQGYPEIRQQAVRAESLNISIPDVVSGVLQVWKILKLCKGGR